MHLAVPQLRYPFSLNHIPRTFDVSPGSDSSVHKPIRFQAHTQHTSNLPPTSMTTTLSAFPNIGNASMVVNRKPIAPRHCTSFSFDRPISSTSRRHSWTSSYDIFTTSGTLDDMFEDSSNENARERRAATPRLLRPGATFDMAYFLKNTGPPPPRENVDKEKRLAGKKKSLGMFKKRKEGGVTINGSPPRKTLDNFVPPERVEQKVTMNGQRYLQIIPNSSNYNMLNGNIGRSTSQSSNPNKLSVSFSDRTDTIETEALESWFSNFAVQYKEFDHNVEPPISQGSHITSSEGPRRSHSFKSNPRSWLLDLDNGGFGLSIIEEPALSETCSGASDIRAALGSNPPTVSSSLSSHPKSVYIEIPKQSAILTDGQLLTGSSLEENGAEKKMEHRYSVDRLAGQGLRRPFKEHEQLGTKVSARRNSNIEAPRSRSSSPKLSEQAQAIEHRHSVVSATQSRRNREVVVRARKIRELQRARHNIDARKKQEQVDRPTTPLDSNESETMNFPSPPKSNQRSSIAMFSTDCGTGYTPVTATENVRLSPVMLVAEQIPIHRSKQVNKPANLILMEQSSKPNAIAVRTDGHEICSPVETQVSKPLRESSSRSEGVIVEKMEQYPTTPVFAPKNTSTTAPGVPPKSLARATPAIPNYKHISSPLLTTPLPVISAPQAVTATTTTRHRTSVCSSHTSASKEARLEARLEALERENRLLEAALMAVLKTSGTLNRCPCVLLSRRQDAVGLKEGRGSRQILQTQGKGEKVDGCVTDSEEKRGSVESNDSGISALEVYLGTRLG